jgi:hypothetical protein
METKRSLESDSGSAPDISRIPTQPFGTKGVASAAATAVHAAPPETASPFRFAVPELPTSAWQEPVGFKPFIVPLEQLLEANLHQAFLPALARDPSPAAPHSRRESARSKKSQANGRIEGKLGLCALGGMCVLALVIWLGVSSHPVTIARPSEPKAAGRDVPLRATADVIDSQRVAPSEDLQRPVLTPASSERALDSPTRPAQQLTEPTRAATLRPQPSPDLRPTVPEAPKAKHPSVLTTVLAPAPN